MSSSRNDLHDAAIQVTGERWVNFAEMRGQSTDGDDRSKAIAGLRGRDQRRKALEENVTKRGPAVRIGVSMCVFRTVMFHCKYESICVCRMKSTSIT
jgi:hypothetical protein